MRFARRRASGGAGARHSLLVSGMPAPDAAFLAAGAPPDLGPPAVPRAALEARLARHLGVAPERVLVTLGTSGALHLAAARWLREGARVAVELPSYEALRALPRFFGAEVRTVRRREEQGWRLDPADVEAALAGGTGPGHLFLSNPHNPTGAVEDAEGVRALAAAAARAGGLLLCDEVYMELAPGPRRVRALELAPNAVALGSLTKAYGLGALRIGWLALGSGVAEERASLEDLLMIDYVDPPAVATRLGLAAMEHLERLRGSIETLERESKPLFERWLRETPGVAGAAPRWGLVAFPRLAGVDDTRDFARFAAARHDVDVVPGEFFGEPGCIRLGFGLPADELAAALRRLAAAVADYRAAPPA